jgi:hypothetical protein
MQNAECNVQNGKGHPILHFALYIFHFAFSALVVLSGGPGLGAPPALVPCSA